MSTTPMFNVIVYFSDGLVATSESIPFSEILMSVRQLCIENDMGDDKIASFEVHNTEQHLEPTRERGGDVDGIPPRATEVNRGAW